ncbi:MAG TPA: serine hydrolase [Pyrinomonadaceae bacterium]|jgi:CubicO group peptidase (beta-lactamase class C family)
MKRKFLYPANFLLEVFLITCAAFSIQAQTTDKVNTASPAKLQSKIDEFVAPYLTMQDLSGAILVSQNGKILFANGYGYSDFETRAANTPETRFRIGSLNKQLTAATVLLLEEKGKLKTQDTVAKFFADFPNGDQITIQHLLTHKSGLPKYVPFKDLNREPSSAELVKIIGALQPEAKPGERYGYSNAGFVLLALIVEKVSGKSFPQFLTENVFKPLGMKHSGVGFSASRKIAKGYVTGVGTEIAPAPSLGVFNYQVFSTVEDLNKWQTGLYGGKLLQPASLAKMTTDYGDRYGYGLSVGKSSPRYFGHDGVYSGYNGFVTYFPDEKLSIVYLGNIESGALGALQTNLPEIAFGKEFKAAEVREYDKSAATADFQNYVGRYEVFPGFYLDVKFEKNVLSLRGPMGAFIALTPIGGDEFFYRHLYAKVAFVRGENRKIGRLDWADANGSTYPCKKISSEY